MRTLKGLARAIGTSIITLPSDATICVPSWTVQFPPAHPPKLPSDVLKKTYTSKPLVDVDGEHVFGELAIVLLLAKDGWTALWADTFHGRKFWSGMPHKTEPVFPPSPVKSLYDRIAARKGGPSGCFDVVAWRGERIIWVEYKGPNDRPNQNESHWLEAALGAGVVETDLLLVGNRARPDV